MIRQLFHREAVERIPEFVRLLGDAVEHGNSIGFLAPFSEQRGTCFWASVLRELSEAEEPIETTTRLLFIDETEGRIQGTVQLSFAPRQNSRHRAEVQKLIVHSSAQRRGLASQLLQHAENAARRHGRTLLILDTETACPAARLYEKLGWQLVGNIPRFAADTTGKLIECSLYYKELLQPNPEHRVDTT